jgi:hypothetical protein
MANMGLIQQRRKSPVRIYNANEEQKSERIYRTSSADMASESNRDSKRSYGTESAGKSEPADNSEASGQESQYSIPQDGSISRSSGGLIIAAGRDNDDNQATAVINIAQIAD